MKSMDRKIRTAAQPRHARTADEPSLPEALQAPSAEKTGEGHARREALQTQNVERESRTAAQPRHARTADEPSLPRALRAPSAEKAGEGHPQREGLSMQNVLRAKEGHARREALRTQNVERESRTAAQPRHARTGEGHSSQGGFQMQRVYRESMSAARPSGRFLSQLEGEMRRGLQKRRTLSPRRLLLPAAAVAAVFMLALGLVAHQARRAGAPTSALQPLSAATPSEIRTASASEIQTASAGEIRTASPSEIRTASAGEIQTASAGEIRTASLSEIRTASAGEIQTASASEAEPRRNTAMSEDEARARVLEVDRDAAAATNIFAFPCAESDGAFVVVRQTLDDATWTTNGRVWYVTKANAWLLAQKDVIWSWTHDLDSFSPEVFSICHGSDRDRSALAWIVLDGRPVEVKNAPSIYDVEPTRGALMGQVAFQNYDYAFLGVDASDPENVQFYQIEGVELTREQFLTFPGAQEVLDLVEGSGRFSIYQILYWQDSAMALNFMQGDLERTTYLYFVDGKLQCEGGWFGDDIGLLSGRATAFRSLPIPVRHTRLNP